MKQLLFLLIFFLSTSSILFGQLEKGDWMLASNNNVNINVFTTNIRATNKVGIMTSDRTMFGLNVGVKASLLRNATFFGHTFNYDFSLFMKRFLNKRGQLLPFFEWQAGFEQRKSSDFFRNDDNEILNLDLKLGALQFIAPNIALEATVGARVIQYDNVKGNINNVSSNTGRLYANIGLKTFLKDGFTDNQDIRSSYLKQGNYKISGRGFIQNSDANEVGLFSQRNLPTFPSKKGVQLSLSPNVQYFKTDYWILGGGVNLGFLATGAGYRIHAGILFQSGIYLRLKNNLFFAPNIGIGYNRTITNADVLLPGVLPSSPRTLTRIRSSFQVLSIPVDLQFRWFMSRKMILSLGSLIRPFFSESRSFGNRTDVTGNLYVDLEYFIAPNLALQTTLAYNTRLNNTFTPSSTVFSLDSGQISFGLSYFIFR